MATNAGFNPPVDPCDETIHTATEIVALRDAGDLRINCHYRVQGPVIGEAGNTSPTVIELHAVLPDSLSKEAKVWQNFNPEGAFLASYDPDANTANGGTLNELLDHWGNQLRDENPGSDPNQLVHNFPYHVSGPNLKQNDITDCTLTGWGSAVSAGVLIWDNNITDAGIHLGGMTDGTFLRNTIRGPQITVDSPNVEFSSNAIESVSVTLAGTAPGVQIFQGNVLRDGTSQVEVLNTAAAVVNITGNQVGGGFRIRVADKPTGTVNVRGNLCEGTNSGAAPDVLLSGSGTTTFNGNTVRGSAMVTVNAGSAGNKTFTDSYFLDGYITEVAPTSTAAITLDGSTFTGHSTTAVDLFMDGSGTRSFNDSVNYAHPSQQQYTLPGAGIVGVSFGSVMNGARIVRDPATTANVTLSQTRGSGSIIQGPGATVGALTLVSCEINAVGTVITQNGPGLISGNSCRLAANISNTATATRGLIMTNCDLLGGTLQQTRTGGTGSDSVHSLTLRSSFSFVTLAGAADPGTPQTPVNFVTVESGGQLTVTDPVGSAGPSPVCVQNTQISSNASVSGTGTGLVNACRFSAHATVNLGAFSHDGCVVDGSLTITATAGNNGSLANASFSNWV